MEDNRKRKPLYAIHTKGALPQKSHVDNVWSYRCGHCGGDAEVVLMSYYHDGSPLCEVKACSNCAVDLMTDHRKNSDSTEEEERPPMTFVRKFSVKSN